MTTIKGGPLPNSQPGEDRPTAGWIRVGVFADGELKAHGVFAPASTIRVGSGLFNDLVVAVLPYETLVVITDGSRLNLIPGSRLVTCGANGENRLETTFEEAGPIVDSTAPKASLTNPDGSMVFIEYHQTRDDAERARAANGSSGSA